MILGISNLDADTSTSSPEISMMGSLGATDLHSRHEGKPERGTNGIIGNSSALQSVLAEAERVAPTKSTVLDWGDGYRQGVDCSCHSQSEPTLPSSIRQAELRSYSLRPVGSELFRHEKRRFHRSCDTQNWRFRDG
jgi:hypothetical protein